MQVSCSAGGTATHSMQDIRAHVDQQGSSRSDLASPYDPVPEYHLEAEGTSNATGK